MKIITRVADAQAHARSSDQRRVLVPTMGALHRGHLELIRVAREQAGDNGEVVVSVFVNPLQFEPGSDFEKYPRPIEADEKACRDAGVDVLFRPGADEMYAADQSIYVDETALSQRLEGASRPGHFRGVCTVVAKLFNATLPNAAVFGEKDFQQLAVVRRMVRDLNFPVEIVSVQTVRESDGLALSSRNAYLSADEREQATVLRRAALELQLRVRNRERAAADLINVARSVIEAAPAARVDYVEIVHADSLEPVSEISANAVLLLAVYIGKTRLIDNLRFT